MVVPLWARGRILGTITFATGSSGRCYDASDLTLAESLASRAAVAVDNARLYTETEQAVRVRDEFLGSASHELRTPIGHVKGFVSSLRQTDVEWDEEVRQDFLAEIERETDRLAKLIGDLLDMTRLESGGLDQIERLPVTPAAVVAGGLDRVRGLVRGHHVQVDVSDDLPDRARRRFPARARDREPGRERREVQPARAARSGSSAPGAKASSSCVSRMKDQGSPPTSSNRSSRSSTGDGTDRPPSRGPGWGSRSAVASSRRTAGASGPNAASVALVSWSSCRSRPTYLAPGGRRRPAPAGPDSGGVQSIRPDVRASSGIDAARCEYDSPSRRRPT